MWLAGSESVDVFLGRARLGLCRRGEAPEWRTIETGSDPWSAVLDAMELRPRAAVRVWLSGSLARPFVLPAMVGLKTMTEAMVVAASRAPEETGLEGPCCVSIDAWKPGESSVCVAMSEGLRAAIEASNAKKIRVTSIRPWWSAVLCDPAMEAQSLALLTVDDGESLVALAGAGDGTELAASYTPAPDETQHAALVQRILASAPPGATLYRHATLAITEASSVPPRGSSCPFAATWSSGS